MNNDISERISYEAKIKPLERRCVFEIGTVNIVAIKSQFINY